MKIIGRVPLWILLCLFALSHSTETIYTSALPTISNYFGISGGYAQLSSSIYFVGFAVGILFLGRISDLYGRRPLVLFGMALYIVSSITVIFASNIEMLIFLRFCQGFGASVGSVIGQAMARDSYSGSELSYIYANLALGIAFIPSIGSSIGGYITQYAGWRYIFVFLTMVSAALFMLYAKYLPETNPYIGAINRANYFSIFKVVITDRIVLLYAFIVGAFNGMTFGFYIEAPFLFIGKIGVNPSFYGKLAFLLTIANICGSMLNKFLMSKHIDNKKIMVYGLILSNLGCFMLIVNSFAIEQSKNLYIAVSYIFVPMMLHVIGHSFLIPSALRFALEDYVKVTGTAGSIFGFLYYLLVALISFSVSKIHSDTITNFVVLFFTLSVLCSISFYLIQRSRPIKQKYNFD